MPKKYPERVIYHQVLTLRYFKINTSTFPNKKLRVIISSKIAKKATDRNLVRRRIKEVWRQLPIPPDIAVTIYTKATILNQSFAEINNILTGIARQLNQNE